MNLLLTKSGITPPGKDKQRIVHALCNLNETTVTSQTTYEDLRIFKSVVSPQGSVWKVRSFFWKVRSFMSLFIQSIAKRSWYAPMSLSLRRSLITKSTSSGSTNFGAEGFARPIEALSWRRSVEGFSTSQCCSAALSCRRVLTPVVSCSWFPFLGTRGLGACEASCMLLLSPTEGVFERLKTLMGGRQLP